MRERGERARRFREAGQASQLLRDEFLKIHTYVHRRGANNNIKHRTLLMVEIHDEFQKHSNKNPRIYYKKCGFD